MTNALRALVPMAHVASVRRSIAFYAKLGFAVDNTHVPDGADEPSWAWLRSHDAHLMVTTAGEPVDPTKQAVLFYGYSQDVAAFRDQLIAAGVDAGPISHPFWSPRGEFRVDDPDGYCIIISHTP